MSETPTPLFEAGYQSGLWDGLFVGLAIAVIAAFAAALWRRFLPQPLTAAAAMGAARPLPWKRVPSVGYRDARYRTWDLGLCALGRCVESGEVQYFLGLPGFRWLMI